VRVLIARGASGHARTLETIAPEDPDIAAVTSITPADACTVAEALSMAYAVQSWDDDVFGKALLWKPRLQLLASRRMEFLKSERRASAPTRGMLTVTLKWNDRPLDVACLQFSREPFEAELQLVAAARELAMLERATIVAADSGGCDPALLPSLQDSWSMAQWHAIALPPEQDLAQAARGAFGLTPDLSPDDLHARYRRSRKPQLRILHSSQLSVLRARRIADESEDLARAALVTDVHLLASAVR
jgi:hypothetical protein